MYILALNSGSSSLKYQIFDTTLHSVIVSGMVEKIGLSDSFITQKYPDDSKQRKECEIKNHSDALNLVISMLEDASIDINKITGVGHRVVHGGEKFACSVEIDDAVIHTIQELSDLAPLHNPANLLGIIAATELLPNARQVAIFDTSFHQTMPDFSYRYAVPNAWYTQLGVRKYGFHGTSHLYVSKRAAKMLGKHAHDCNIISLHIGSGASACAIKSGISIDTSLGMTPLPGLMMGTRCGDLDPSVPFYIKEKLGLSDQSVLNALNKQSGILGITECYADRRDVMANIESNDNCRLAIDIEVFRAKKFIGEYLTAISSPVDAIIFTAGVGENNSWIREKICNNMEHLGIKLDASKNDQARAFMGSPDTEISAPDSPVKIFMIPTNEELVLIEDTIAIINGTYNPNHLDMKYSFN